MDFADATSAHPVEFDIAHHLFSPRLLQSVTGRAHFAHELRKHGFAVFRLDDPGDQACVQAMHNSAKTLFTLPADGENSAIDRHHHLFYCIFNLAQTSLVAL